MPAEMVLISNARLSFPHLIEPQVQVDATTGNKRITYSADLIIAPDHPAFATLMKEIQKIATEKWGEHAGAVLQMIQNDRKQRCFGQGNEKIDKKTFKPYSGYANQLYITAITNKVPQVIQADGRAIESDNTLGYQQLTRKMYGGCRVNVAVRPWVQDNKHGRGVRCELIAIQFCADDEAFGEGSTDASGMFGAVAGSASAAPTPAGLPSFFS